LYKEKQSKYRRDSEGHLSLSELGWRRRKPISYGGGVYKDLKVVLATLQKDKSTAPRWIDCGVLSNLFMIFWVRQC